MARTQARKLERWSPPVAALAVFAVFVAVCGVQLGSPGLTEPDEARYAAVGQSMWQSRDFITPRFNGFVYLDKPPLLHWLTALSIGLFGPRESAVRLSCLLAAGAGVALTYAFGRRVYGHQAGLASAAVLGVSIMWFATGRLIRYDMLLALSVAATLWWAWLGSEAGREGRRCYWFAALAAALGVLAKGPVALALPGLIFLLYLALARRLAVLRDVPWLGCLGIVVAIAAPWFALCERANPGAIRFFLVHEHLGRLEGAIDHSHWRPWWYLLPILLAACFPWTFFLPGALIDGVGGWRHGEESQRRACKLWVLWIAVTVAVFSISKVKMWTYILPALPAVALLIGRYVSPPRRKGRWAATATALLLLAGAAYLFASGFRGPLAVPVWPIAALWGVAGLATIVCCALNRRRWSLVALVLAALGSCHLVIRGVELTSGLNTDRAVARQVAALRRPGERIFSVRRLSRGAVFYLDERVAVFGNTPAEYDFPLNRTRLDGWVYPVSQAERVLSTAPSAIVICRRAYWNEFRAAAGDAITQIGGTEKALILRSVPAKTAGAAP